MGDVVGYVFGYASLADERDHLSDFAPISEPNLYGAIAGWRRRWNAAIPNRDSRFDHKFYETASGERFDGAVVSLNLQPIERRSPCNGLAVPIDDVRLELLDYREHVMHRVDVTDMWRGRHSLSGRPLWAYVADEAAVRTYESFKSRNRAVVGRGYLERVENAFRSRGPEAFRQYLASTDPPDVPVADLSLIRAEGRRGF